MKLQTLFLAFSALLVVSLSIYALFGKSSVVKTPIIPQPNPIEASEIPLFSINEPKSNDHHLTQEPVNKPTFIVKKKVCYDDAFSCEQIEDLQQELPSRKNVEPLEAFKIKDNTVKKLFVGDSISLPEINGISYSATVKKRNLNKNGSVTVVASLDNEDSRFYCVMTQNKHVSFITLFSPEGSFEFEAVDGGGYVYSSADINNSMIDHSVSDVIIPEISKELTPQ